VDLVEAFVDQARSCERLGSPLYARLLRRCADDIAAGGPVADVLAEHADLPGPSALALRLLGSVHRLVLQGRLPGLATHYPSVGGDGDADAAWQELRAALATHADLVRPLLDRAPQTNEVGRSAALVGGLLHLVAEHLQPVVLHEIGSSAGLNLHADAFCLCDADDDHLWGPPDSPVRLHDAWRGPRPPVDADLRIERRLGSDLAPLDVDVPRDVETLLSYVWADMTERLERLRAALLVARQQRVTVDRLDAAGAARRLELVPGRTVVLWHSVMWQYIGEEQQQTVARRLEELGERATAESPLAHLFLEPTRRTSNQRHEMLVVLQTWPGRRRILGSAPGHGLPVAWEHD
jgi:hypothetical protein